MNTRASPRDLAWDLSEPHTHVQIDAETSGDTSNTPVRKTTLTILKQVLVKRMMKGLPSHAGFTEACHSEL